MQTDEIVVYNAFYLVYIEEVIMRFFNSFFLSIYLDPILSTSCAYTGE